MRGALSRAEWFDMLTNLACALGKKDPVFLSSWMRPIWSNEYFY